MRIGGGLLGKVNMRKRFAPHVGGRACAINPGMMMVGQARRWQVSDRTTDISKLATWHVSGGGHEVSILIRRVG
jgi:hypothetical protein